MKNEKLEAQEKENEGFKEGIETLTKSVEELKEETDRKLKEMLENIETSLKESAESSKIIPGAIAA